MELWDRPGEALAACVVLPCTHCSCRWRVGGCVTTCTRSSMRTDKVWIVEGLPRVRVGVGGAR